MKRFVISLLITLIIADCISYADTSAKGAPKEDVGKRIVLVAGPDSHAYGMHDFRGGVRYLAHCLRNSVSGLIVDVYEGGWPDDPDYFNDADAVVIYSDGLAQHILTESQKCQLNNLHEEGVGLGFMHYACAVEKESMGETMLKCIGGYYETYWSVNPYWDAEFLSIPNHEVTRGVKPFVINDEWYYNMRFREGMMGVTPVLTAVPPDKTRERGHGPHSGNSYVSARKGKAEHVSWVAVNEEKGRGFGLTGLHYYWNLGHPEMRRLVLNATVWLAGIEVPEEGIVSENPSLEFLEKLNPGMPDKNWINGKRAEWAEMLSDWHQFGNSKK